MHCWNCRKEIPDGAASCRHCEAKQNKGDIEDECFDCGALYCFACGAVLPDELVEPE